MWWLLACLATDSGPSGVWTLRGEGVVGQISHGSGCDQGSTIGLWGPRWGTDGMVSVQLEQESEGVWWAHFPVEIGLGTAMAALRLEGGSAQMPMGGRPGEFSLDLRRSEGALSAAERQAAQDGAAASLETERQSWRNGGFLLKDQDAVVGEVHFRGERPPLIAVYDAWWLTPAPVPADVVPEGADLVLRFSVEPAMGSEDGELRINVPLREVVAPLGKTPVDEERRFELVPGRVTEEARAEHMAQAVSLSDTRERQMVMELGVKLSVAARTDEGCLKMSDVDPAFSLLFTGYEVAIVQEAGDCVVEIEPSRAQHGRRFKGRIGGG